MGSSLSSPQESLEQFQARILKSQMKPYELLTKSYTFTEEQIIWLLETFEYQESELYGIADAHRWANPQVKVKILELFKRCSMIEQAYKSSLLTIFWNYPEWRWFLLTTNQLTMEQLKENARNIEQRNTLKMLELSPLEGPPKRPVTVMY